MRTFWETTVAMEQFQVFDGEVWELVIYGPYEATWIQCTTLCLTDSLELLEGE